MSLALYMDVHVPAAVSEALINAGIDILTSQRDGTTRTADPELLDRAGELGRVLVTQDQDFLADANRRQRLGMDFSGVIFAPQNQIPPRKFIEDLELMALVMDPEEMRNSVRFLPLQ